MLFIRSRFSPFTMYFISRIVDILLNYNIKLLFSYPGKINKSFISLPVSNLIRSHLVIHFLEKQM